MSEKTKIVWIFTQTKDIWKVCLSICTANHDINHWYKCSESAMALDIDIEKRCRQLFNEMSDPLLKLKVVKIRTTKSFFCFRCMLTGELFMIYSSKDLQTMVNCFGCFGYNKYNSESFKCEYSKIVEAQKNTKNTLNNSVSPIGKNIELWKTRMNNWNVLRAKV